jgi:hypothetical protein
MCQKKVRPETPDEPDSLQEEEQDTNYGDYRAHRVE